MKKRLLYGLAIVLLALSVLLVVSQATKFGQFGLPDPQHTLIYWGVYILIFILIVTLGFILFREFVKLYYARQSHQEGSRIRTKLVLGAITLSVVPVFFLVWFSFLVLSTNMNAWFTEPPQKQHDLFADVAKTLQKEMQDETNVQAALLASKAEIHELVKSGTRAPGLLDRFCAEQELESAEVLTASGETLDTCRHKNPPLPADRLVHAEAGVLEGGTAAGKVRVTARIPLDVAGKMEEIRKSTERWNEILAARHEIRRGYTMLMALITLFVVFLAVWIALFLAKQISVPITAVLEAAGEVRRGNLAHRVDVRAVDELGSLVRAFNRMTEDLDANSRELDRRRRFTEAILESIPTGVISIASDGSIKRVNRALSKIFPPEQAEKATRLEDLFSREDTAEIKYLMKRARRTGLASRQIELRTENRKLHLAVTVSALEERLTSGFVVVLEDTSELLRAQKAAAWHEVARRIAHEIKNPLTPIALSAERMERQIDRLEVAPSANRILHECAATITKSVESVKMLVDEFAQFARFPAAQPVRCDLNEVVGAALAVFKGRLEGIDLRTSFAPNLPPVYLDPEQFQRVVVNLVDNAAEAMQDSLVKNLLIATRAGVPDTLELVVADSGPGVSSDDKEKLFLPYFSTKNRGTGLGLAIVSHIVAEHNAQIRVEDNRPSGARFTVEIPVLLEADAAETSARPAAAKV